MASSNNLDALSQDGKLPFGHPGRKFDDTPTYFEDFDDRNDAFLRCIHRRKASSTTARVVGRCAKPTPTSPSTRTTRTKWSVASTASSWSRRISGTTTTTPATACTAGSRSAAKAASPGGGSSRGLVRTVGSRDGREVAIIGVTHHP